MPIISKMLTYVSFLVFFICSLLCYTSFLVWLALLLFTLCGMEK
jgi:hypothetical protein